MKKLKLIVIVITAFVCLNLVFAKKPDTLSTDSIINPMIEYLNFDVKLTATQKDILKKSAYEYASNLLKARKMNKSDESYMLMKITSEKYQAVVDSTLTTDQKNQKAQKSQERLDEINSIANSKK